MKKVLICFVALLILGSVSALSVQANSVDKIVVPDFNKPAKMQLTITDAEEGSYNVYTLTGVSIKPTSPFELHSGTNEIEVYVYPTASLNERGYYTFTYNLKKIGGANYEDRMSVRILDLKDLIDLESSADFDSGQIVIALINKENIELKGVSVRFSSFLFDTQGKVDLTPEQDSIISIDVDKTELSRTKPGSYVVSAEFNTLNGKKEIDGTIFIGEKKGISTQEDSSGFLIHTNSITKIDVGNVEEVVSIQMKKDVFSRLFTSFNIEPTSVDRSGISVEYSWSDKLMPGEVLNVKARTSYIIPFLIVVFAVFVVLGFRRYSETKIDVKKSVHHVRTKGGEFALRVNISVNAKTRIENVSIIDRVPAMVKIYNKFGTIKPDKIDAKTRRLHWNIGDLNAGEERVFSYVVYSKIGIVGRFALPEAMVLYEKDGEVSETSSNVVYFLSEQIKGEE